MPSDGRGASAAPFVWRAGVHVAGTGLWCDALRAQDLCFLGSALAALQAATPATASAAATAGWAARTLLCTERTYRLWRAAGAAAGAPGGLLLSPFGRPFSLGRLRLELFPSGLLPGAASLWLQLPSGRCLVYAGALNPRAGALGEPMQVRAADALLCHAPLAALGVTLPERAAAAQAVQAAVAGARADGAVAVLLCPPLGTAQELLHLLGPLDGALHVHPLIARYLRGYQQLGLLRFGERGSEGAPGPRRFRRPLPRGAVLLWPLELPLPAPPQLCADAATPRVYLCTGAAAAPPAVARYEAALRACAGLPLTAALPFPDGIDLPDLLRYVGDTETRDLYLTAGYGAALAAALQARKVRVQTLGPPRQLMLL